LNFICEYFQELFPGVKFRTFVDSNLSDNHHFRIDQIIRLMMRYRDRQIMIITHSPYFVDTTIFKPDRCLIYINRVNSRSIIRYPEKNYQLKIIPSLFEPAVFFSKFNLVVEGAADEAIFVGLSEKLGYVLERNDITIVGPDGSGNVKNYHSLFTEYRIDHLAIVDSPYNGLVDDKVIVLNGKLENELQKLGWMGDVESSIKPNAAYKFITELADYPGGLAKIRNSGLGHIFSNAVTAAGGVDPFGR
jgi:hypothetical protein